MLVEGEWKTQKQFQNEEGRFVRSTTSFRDWVTADGSSVFLAEAGRYHLYISWACPWAHRTAMMRTLKGLDGAISLSSVDPFMGDDGWMFSDDYPDSLNGAKYLREIYTAAAPDYTGRVTTPVLWDKERNVIVNNESRDLIRIFDTEFESVSTTNLDLCPPDLRDEIETTIDAIYEPVNNGVYKSGFASKQEVYEEAVMELFEALDHWDDVLGSQRYLCGDRLTEADICLFTTLIRFDPVYHGHFKCNVRRIVDYPNLSGYLRDIYQIPGIAETVYLDDIKRHYYTSHESVNPTRIVPVGPDIDLNAPHDRERFAV